MESPYSPRYPAVPNHTPRSSASRKPIHNPYDKFTQPQFDEWISGITRALRKALGEEDEEEPSSGRMDGLEYGTSSGGSHGEDGDDLDDAVEDSFADLKARREKVLGKMRAVEDLEEYESDENGDYDSDSVPIRGLGSSPGNAIELLSSEEEDELDGEVEADEEASVRNMIRDFGSDSEEERQPSPGGSNVTRPTRRQYPEVYEFLSDTEEYQNDESQFSQPPDIRDPWSFPKQYFEDIYTGGDLPDLDRSRLSPSHLTPDVESETEESNIRNLRNGHTAEFRRVGHPSNMFKTRSSLVELMQEDREIQDTPHNHKDNSYTDVFTGQMSNSPEIRTSSKVEEVNDRSSPVDEDADVDRDEIYANDLEYDELLEDPTDREGAPEPDTPDIRERLGEYHFPTPHLQRQGSPIFTLNDRVDWTTPTFDSRVLNVVMVDEGDETGSESDMSEAEVVSVGDEDGDSYQDMRSPLPLGTSDLEVPNHDSDDEQEDEEDDRDPDFDRYRTALANGHDQNRELSGSWDVEEPLQTVGETDSLHDNAQEVSASGHQRPTIEESTAPVFLHDSMFIPPPVFDMERRSPRPVASQLVPSAEEYASIEAALGEEEVPILELSKTDDPRIPDHALSGIISDENSASVLGDEVPEQDDPSAERTVKKADETINVDAIMTLATQNQDVPVDTAAVPSISEAEFLNKIEFSETESAWLAEPDTVVDSIEITLAEGVTQFDVLDKSVPQVEETTESPARWISDNETHVSDVETVAHIEEFEEEMGNFGEPIGFTDQQQDDINVEVLSAGGDDSKEPTDYAVEELVSEGRRTEEPEMSIIDWEASRNISVLIGNTPPPMSPVSFVERDGEEFASSLPLKTDEAFSCVHKNEMPKDSPEFIMPIIANPNVRDPTSINHTPAVSVSSQPDTPMSSSMTLPVAAAVTKFMRDNNLSTDDARSASGLFTPLDGEESPIAPSPSAGNLEGVETHDSVVVQQESLSETPSISLQYEMPVEASEVVEPDVAVAPNIFATDIEAPLIEDRNSTVSSSHTPELNRSSPLFSEQETQNPSVEVDHTDFEDYELSYPASDPDVTRDQDHNTNVPCVSEVLLVIEDPDVAGDEIPDPESATTVADSQETKVDAFGKDTDDDLANLNAEVKEPDTVFVSITKENEEEDPFKLMGNDSTVAPGEIDVITSDGSTPSSEGVDADPKGLSDEAVESENKAEEPTSKESMEYSAALPQQPHEVPPETKDLNNEEEHSSGTEEKAMPLKRKRSPSVLGSPALTRSLSQGNLRTYGRKSLDSGSPTSNKGKRADGLAPSPGILSPVQVEPSASASNGDMPMFHGHGKSKKIQTAIQPKSRKKDNQETSNIVNDAESLQDGYKSIRPTSQTRRKMTPTVQAPIMKARIPTPPPTKPYIRPQYVVILPPSMKTPIKKPDAITESIQPYPDLKITVPSQQKPSSAASQALSSPTSPLSSASSFDFSPTTQPTSIKTKVQNSPVTRRYARTSTSASQPTASSGRRHDHNSRSTRSQCRYRKISLPEDEGGPRVTFLVPQCSLNDKELMAEEEITDDGPATQSNYENCYENVETLNFIPYLISVLRLVVGVELVRDNEIYYLPANEGEVVMRRTPHGALRRASRYGFAEDEDEENDSPQKTVGVAPGHGQITSKSTAAPVSFAGSTSTASSSFRRGSARSITDEDENGEERAPPTKRRKRAHTNRVTGRDRHTKGDSGASATASPTSTRVLKRRLKKGLSHDTGMYNPHTDQESTDEDEQDDVPKWKKSTNSRGLKRSRADGSSPLKESGGGMVKKVKLTPRDDD